MERSISAIFRQTPRRKLSKKIKSTKDIISHLELTIREKKQNLRRLEAESSGLEFAKQELEWVGRGLASPGPRKGYQVVLTELLFGGARGFVVGYTAKALLSLVLALLSGRKSLYQAVKNSRSLDSLQFAQFLGAFVGLFRGANAFMAQWRQTDDKLNSAVAGFIAGFSLLLDAPSRQYFVAFYLLVRAGDIFIKNLARRGVIPSSSHAEPVIFGLLNIPIMYGFLFDGAILDPGYYKWIHGMGVTSDEAFNKTIRYRLPHYQKFGMEGIPPFQCCQMGYHSGSCFHHITTDWFWGLLRAAKMYVPVHFVPMLLFKSRALLKEPVRQLTATAKSTLLSCIFLSTYVFFVKGSTCFLRNYRQWDSPWHGAVSGFLTWLACYFERPSRVNELMLYCVPRAWEGICNVVRQHYELPTIPFIRLPMFCVAMAVIMSASDQDFKMTYFKFMRLLIGPPLKVGKVHSVGFQISRT